MAELTDEIRAVLEQRVFVHVATLMEDGSPHVSPVWVEHAGDKVLINTSEGRLKDRNLRRDGRVALSVTDPDNPYRNILIRGRVEELTPDGADEQIDRLAMKYLGEETYPFRQPGEVRIKVVIDPEKVSDSG
jgi:PPOX class probable F420-dependent enzyme